MTVLALGAGCALVRQPPRATLGRTPTAEEMAELWVDPGGTTARDLFHGVGGADLIPDPGDRYELVSREGAGSGGEWVVVDSHGRRWSVKVGPEAQVEVVASRLVWAAGYHQPPAYWVKNWKLSAGGHSTLPYSGRFRPRRPGMRGVGPWSWRENPFVGTPPYRGLLVLMVILGNPELMDRDNAVYELDPPREGAGRWFVAQDLGSVRLDRPGFVQGIVDGHVHFAYSGGHRELLAEVTPADVRWLCDRLARLTPEQWRDAFRAGGYDDAGSARFIRRLREKVEQGRVLDG